MKWVNSDLQMKRPPPYPSGLKPPTQDSVFGNFPRKAGATRERPKSAPLGGRPRVAPAPVASFEVSGAGYDNSAQQRGGATMMGTSGGGGGAQRSNSPMRPRSAAAGGRQMDHRRGGGEGGGHMAPAEAAAARQYWLKSGKFKMTPDRLFNDPKALRRAERAEAFAAQPSRAGAGPSGPRGKSGPQSGAVRPPLRPTPSKAGAFRRRPIAASLFRKHYERGDLPVAVAHRAGGNRIKVMSDDVRSSSYASRRHQSERRISGRLWSECCVGERRMVGARRRAAVGWKPSVADVADDRQHRLGEMRSRREEKRREEKRRGDVTKEGRARTVAAGRARRHHRRARVVVAVSSSSFSVSRLSIGPRASQTLKHNTDWV